MRKTAAARADDSFGIDIKNLQVGRLVRDFFVVYYHTNCSVFKERLNLVIISYPDKYPNYFRIFSTIREPC